MDENQTGRRSINLSKESSEQPKVREAYPVYKNNNVDRESLERQEYRNTQSSYQRSSYSPQAEPMYQDPPPAVNHYNIPEVQPSRVNNPPVLHNTNDDLGQYYNYGNPEPTYNPSTQQPAYNPQPQQPVYQQSPVQQSMKFCKYCGEKIPLDAVVCTHCGRQVEELKGSAQVPINNNINVQPQQYYGSPNTGISSVSDKTKGISILLAAFGFIGLAGLHRFYLGKPLSGILYLVTGGICGLGTLIDILKIASGTSTDGSGRIVSK